MVHLPFQRATLRQAVSAERRDDLRGAARVRPFLPVPTLRRPGLHVRPDGANSCEAGRLLAVFPRPTTGEAQGDEVADLRPLVRRIDGDGGTARQGLCGQDKAVHDPHQEAAPASSLRGSKPYVWGGFGGGETTHPIILRRFKELEEGTGGGDDGHVYHITSCITCSNL